MAVSLVAVRPREKGTEFVVNVNGRIATLWKADHDPDEDPAVTRAWAENAWQGILAARQADQAEDDADASALNAQGFLNWVRDNRNDPRVNAALRRLARIYREEVI